MSQETKNTTEQDLPVEETVQQPPETGEPVRQPEPAQEPKRTCKGRKTAVGAGQRQAAACKGARRIPSSGGGIR